MERFESTIADVNFDADGLGTYPTDGVAQESDWNDHWTPDPHSTEFLTPRTPEEEASVRVYSQLSNHPLLTFSEEIALAKALARGRQAQTRLESETSSQHIHTSVIKRWQAEADTGREALETLTMRNQKLIMNMAKKYTGRGVPFGDLFQEGNIGLIRGLTKYDWRLGYRLSTYVCWWIRQAIHLAVLEQSRTIRIPPHMIEFISTLSRTEKEVSQTLGRDATRLEIAQKMSGTDEVDPKFLEKIDIAFRALLYPISIYTPLNEDGGDEQVIDNIPDLETDDPSIQAISSNEVHELMKVLTERERKVLDLRYGLGDDPVEMRQEQIAKIFGVKRQRINQIQARALEKLRERLNSR